MSALVTICCLNWKRHDYLESILHALKKQTIPTKIFLWDQSPTPFSSAAPIDWYVRSSINRKCLPRLYLAGWADTPFVCLHDDDLIPTDPRALEVLVQHADRLGQGHAVGLFGVVFDPAKPYWQAVHYHYPSSDTPVDMVKGRVLLAHTSDVRLALNLQHLTQVNGICDDILLCGLIAKGRRMQHFLAGGFRDRYKDLPEDRRISSCLQPGHMEARDANMRIWFDLGSGMQP